MRKITPKQREKNKQKSADRNLMLKMFMEIWYDRPHESEISGKWLGKEALTVFFHHILPKSKYPEAMLDKENIILLTFDEHTNVENNPERYEKINEIRIKLKEKYGRST